MLSALPKLRRLVHDVVKHPMLIHSGQPEHHHSDVQPLTCLLYTSNNLQAPWLGIAAFLSVAVLLTLLIFIGEAVRDAFDPSKAV